MDDAGGGIRGLKPRLTAQLATAVDKVWGVSLEDARPLGGSTGLHLLATMSSERVVVHVHRRYVLAERVEALQSARDAAAGAGLPTARAAPGHGRVRHVVVDGHVVEVEPFIEGDRQMDSLERIRIAMPLLGRLHDVLAATDLPDAANELRFANYLPLNETTDRVARGAERIRALVPMLTPLAEAAEGLAGHIDRRSRELSALDDQWCHGDFWDNNVMFHNDCPVLITDFGFLNRRPRIEDLALTLYFTLSDLDAAHHNQPLETVAQLVDAYDRGTDRPLTSGERDALPVALARQPLWSIGVWAAELDETEAVAAHLDGHHVAIRRAMTILDELSDWRSALRRSGETRTG